MVQHWFCQSLATNNFPFCYFCWLHQYLVSFSLCLVNKGDNVSLENLSLESFPLTKCTVMMENCLFILWRHLEYYLLRCVPADQQPLAFQSTALKNRQMRRLQGQILNFEYIVKRYRFYDLIWFLLQVICVADLVLININ